MKIGTCKDRKNGPNPDWAQIRVFFVRLFYILGTFVHFSVGHAAQGNEQMERLNDEKPSRSVFAFVCMGALQVALAVIVVLSQSNKNLYHRIREVCKGLTASQYQKIAREKNDSTAFINPTVHSLRLMTFYALAFTTLSVSCVNHYHGELTIAETMLNDNPDSSLAVIKRLDAHITDKHEKAFSLYIKTCASAKLGIPITWVEEMESAAPFIETRANSRHKALYYYYLGFAEKENHRLPAAVASFLKSLEFQDPHMRICCYSRPLPTCTFAIMSKTCEKTPCKCLTNWSISVPD